jgi:hypothetical protein
MTDDRRRIVAFAVIASLCVGLACLYAVYAVRRESAETTPSGIRVVASPAQRDAIPGGDRVLFRNTALGQGYGKVVVARVGDESGARFPTELVCDRVDFAGGTGACLEADRGVFTSYRVLIFDEHFNVRHRVGLGGIPSRTRVAPNGRLAAVTVFVSGHSYSAGSFSTLTTLIDTATGAVIADLEQFVVTRNNTPFKAADFNFWGVTFAADSNTFYATLGTGREQLLIRGDAATRTAVVLRAGVECPAMSPDGTRLAFKRRGTEGGVFGWRLATLDLQTLTDRLVPGELRSIDDQVEWLDASHLLYGVSDEESGLGGTSVWKVDVDNGTPAAVWLRGAYSPSVSKPGEP